MSFLGILKLVRRVFQAVEFPAAACRKGFSAKTKKPCIYLGLMYNIWVRNFSYNPCDKYYYRHLVHREVKEMTNYEVMFILDPALEDDKKDATVEAVKEIIASEGEVGNVDVWGMKKLAYPIQKKNEGYYVVIEFKAETTLPKELDRRLKISDNVMRHLIVNKDEK